MPSSFVVCYSLSSKYFVNLFGFQHFLNIIASLLLQGFQCPLLPAWPLIFNFISKSGSLITHTWWLLSSQFIHLITYHWPECARVGCPEDHLKCVQIQNPFLHFLPLPPILPPKVDSSSCQHPLPPAWLPLISKFGSSEVKEIGNL